MSDYWLKRSNELERLTQERTDETVKQVNEMYQTAIDTLRDRAKAVFDRYSKNGKLTEQQALKLLNMNQTKEYREKLLEKYAEAESEEEKKRLETVLDAPAYADRISRIEALANEIYSEALSFGTNEQVQIEKRLIAAYKHSYYKTTFDIQRYTGKYYDFEKLPSNRVKEAIRHKWLGKNYSERVWDNTDRTAEKLKDIIINGVMTGQSIGTMTDALEAAIGSTPDEGARYRFSRLIRTEVNFISGQATQKAYKEAGIGEYVFLATLDKRTCHDCGNEKRMSCAELDGKHFKLSEAEVGVNKHPMHPYCRCSDYPYIKGKKGTRSARDKNGKTILIPDDMTYSEWYEEYVDKEQKSDIIKSSSDNVSISSIDKPIEQRNTGKGNPNAVLLFDVELNNRQKKMLDELTKCDDRLIVNKRDVNMKDLSALTAKTGVEFAMFTNKSNRLIIRGNRIRVNISKKNAIFLANEGYRWSGHTHPGDDKFSLFASDGDKRILECFKQPQSVIYNSKGQYNVFGKEK